MENPGNKNKWFIDKDSRHRWIYHRIKRYIVSAKTGFQQVEFIDTYELGRLVILNNKIQSSEADEFIYHETLVHPAMIAHPNPKIVLILGGGEGATLREVLKHQTVEKVIMVDIDEEFVDLCKKHLKNWHHGSFTDKRVELIFSDAKEYVRKSKPIFDVIIADITDPFEKGPAQKLYTIKFYSDIRKALRTNGIFATHTTGVSYTPSGYIYTDIVKMLTNIFPLTDFYYEYVPSFSSLWGFAVCSQKYSPQRLSSSAVAKRLKKRNLHSLSYYDKKTHTKLFLLPKMFREIL